MSKPTIGFMGLGLMGGAMVSRLQDQGYSVTVLGNRDRTELDKAIARGASEAKSAREVAQASDVVMLCMGTSEHVEGRMLGDDGVLAGLKSGAVVIDFGTSLPASTKKMGEATAAAGGTYLDAPLGRTPTHALVGELNIMCSGDEAAFKTVEPVLNDLAENVFHLGALGNGHTIKLLNNFFGQTVANALAEVFAQADIAGIDRKQVFDVMHSGPLGSPFMAFMAEYALNGDPSKLAFSIKNATKDVGYYDQMTRDAGAPSIMAAAPLQIMKDAIEAGYGENLVPEFTDYYVERLKK
ncbi:NAD(P)-dependent oxidoreductase [Octadecabacter sp. 1_MG-2023]|uniref:NAD(P)-dependent oxidoreductase n=1 Tax=unclassified Octadecabacter TaxID=196158 RepID=UPI001C0845DA|nr:MULTISPECIES: NAD(P)-dependent oxidoreductase [unclassified Octadecabacter]MBU2994756.1 NAD(P)-dependent oxidoreductase [Octadecabacter sp. B2R22]MDO6733950.1 NAD(P)-dependent oxidoreductase [Octadecabacter sp. 1_MG-2023]